MAAEDLHWRDRAEARERAETFDRKESASRVPEPKESAFKAPGRKETEPKDSKEPKETEPKKPGQWGGSARPRAPAPTAAYGTTKYSVGIIVCRQCAGEPYRVAVVRKRYTYAFSDFIHGKYSRSAPKGAMALLDRMTTEELLDVWALDFGQMWYRVWLTAAAGELYAKKRARWEATFIRPDAGAQLRAMVKQARGSNATLWEIPKGHPETGEHDIICGVRELKEETGITKKEYRLVPGATCDTSHLDMGVKYVCKFFIAVASTTRQLASQPGAARALERRGEVGEARWMSLAEIRAVDTPGRHLERLAAPAIARVKKFVRSGL